MNINILVLNGRIEGIRHGADYVLSADNRHVLTRGWDVQIRDRQKSSKERIVFRTNLCLCERGNGPLSELSEDEILNWLDREPRTYQHVELPLKDGVYTLTTGQIINRRVHFRNYADSDLCRQFGLTSVVREDPNQLYEISMTDEEPGKVMLLFSDGVATDTFGMSALKEVAKNPIPALQKYVQTENIQYGDVTPAIRERLMEIFVKMSDGHECRDCTTAIRGVHNATWVVMVKFVIPPEGFGAVLPDEATLYTLQEPVTAMRKLLEYTERCRISRFDAKIQVRKPGEGIDGGTEVAQSWSVEVKR